ncbi:hypothetical protein [Moritella sp.]|uniref:hypothetical protein n=1 Tax=Moritella sp. TaxID=78556 RepID=UPI0025D3E05A|nr:hypothetical protein [Moritella sp.]
MGFSRHLAAFCWGGFSHILTDAMTVAAYRSRPTQIENSIYSVVDSEPVTRLNTLFQQ